MTLWVPSRMISCCCISLFTNAGWHRLTAVGETQWCQSDPSIRVCIAAHLTIVSTMCHEICEFAMRVLLLFVCLVTLHAVLSTTNQLRIYNIYGVQMPCGDGPRITGVCCQWKSLSVTCVTTTPSRLLHSHFPHKLHTSHGQRLLIQQGNYQPTVCYYYNCHQSNKVKRQWHWPHVEIILLCVKRR